MKHLDLQLAGEPGRFHHASETKLIGNRNFFVFQAIMVPFEITACNLIIHFWSQIVPTGAIIAIIIVLYAVINVTAVKW